MGSLIKISPKQIKFLKINCSLTQLKITVLLAILLLLICICLWGFFFKVYFALYIWTFSRICVYHIHAEYVEVRRAYHIPWSGATKGCEPPCEFWGSNPGPVRKKPVYSSHLP